MDEIYFVENTQETQEGRAQNVVKKEGREIALSTYHSVCASNYAAAAAGTLKSFAVAFQNAKLYPELRESWNEPEPAPEPNEEA